MTIRKYIFLFVVLLLLVTCVTRKGVIVFVENNKYGLKSLDGNIVLKPQFDYIGETEGSHNDILSVHNNKKWGLLNRDGKLITKINYDSNIGPLSESGIAPARLNGLYGFIDKEGNIIVPFIYDFALWFRDGIAEVVKNGKRGFINEKGNIVIPIEYDQFEYHHFQIDLIAARKKQKWGFIDRNNKNVVPFDYYEAIPFSEGLAMVEGLKGKWGFIDQKNKNIIPFIYDNPYGCDWNTGEFKNGMAIVSLNDRLGYINRKGEAVIPFKYYCIRQFCNGYAGVQVDNGEKLSGKRKILQYGYVDSTGKEYLYEYQYMNGYDWQVRNAPPEIPDSSYLLKSSDKATTREWTLEKLLSLGLTAFRQSPIEYPDLCNHKQICIANGFMLGAGPYGEKFMYPRGYPWYSFLNGTIYKIISSESLRQATWNWIQPYYKQSFRTTNPFIQKTYKEIAVYLKNYINHYDQNKVKAYLERDEKRFAYYDMNELPDPNRKLSAFVDRLIVIHKVISVDEAKAWINKVADDVATW